MKQREREGGNRNGEQNPSAAIKKVLGATVAKSIKQPSINDGVTNQ